MWRRSAWLRSMRVAMVWQKVCGLTRRPTPLFTVDLSMTSLTARGNHAILSSLTTQDQKLVAFEAKLAGGEVRELPLSDPCGVQELQDRSIA